MARTKIVLELGVGKRAKKIVELALRHPRTMFVGVDNSPVNYKAELRALGEIEMPRNLKIHSNTDAIAFLKEQPQETFSHIYAHNFATALSFEQRQELFAHASKALQNRGRLTLFEPSSNASQLDMELRAANFSTKRKGLSATQVLGLGNEDAIMGFEVTQRAKGRGVNEVEELKKIMRELHLKVTPVKSPKAHAALERFVQRTSALTGKTPYTAIHAVKGG